MRPERSEVLVSYVLEDPMKAPSTTYVFECRVVKVMWWNEPKGYRLLAVSGDSSQVTGGSI